MSNGLELPVTIIPDVLAAAAGITGQDDTHSIADAFLDHATAFGCGEIEKIADLFRAFRLDEMADNIIEAHASGDEPGDLHHDEE